MGFNWQKDLQDQVSRDIISRVAFEKLLGGAGISPEDTVVLYGDNNNWFAAYGFWLFTIYGHESVKLMNGGRQKWLNEQDKPFTTEKPTYPPVSYAAKPPDAAAEELERLENQDSLREQLRRIGGLVYVSDRERGEARKRAILRSVRERRLGHQHA